MFSLTLLDGGKGDATIVHHTGASAKKRVGLVDGGTKGRFRHDIKPALALDGIKKGQGALDWLAISHVDDDHIGGVERLLEAKFRSNRYFFNSPRSPESHGVTPATTPAVLTDASRLDALLDRLDHGVAPQTIAQGEKVVNEITSQPNGLALINPNKGARLVAGAKVSIDGLDLEIVGPLKERLDELIEEWEAEFPGVTPQAIKDTDDKVANLSSLTFVAIAHGKSVLFTGDAIEDDVLAGLERTSLKKPWHVNVLKLPHHGSTSAWTNSKVEAGEGLLELVSADHYIVPANGENTNPAIESMERIVKVVGDGKATVWFPTQIKQGSQTSRTHYRAAIEALELAISDAGADITIKRRLEGEDPLVLPLSD